MSRILSVTDENAGLLQRIMLWQSRRQYGVVPGVFRLLLPVLRIGLPVSKLYEYLHLRKNSPMTRLQREMIATLVNGVVGGAP
jgi:hypothetical protein